MGDEPIAGPPNVGELLARAACQEGLAQLLTLALVSQALAERLAPPGPLAWADQQLRAYLDACRRGETVVVSPALPATLAALADPAAPTPEVLRALGRHLDAHEGRALRLEVRGAEMRLGAWLPAKRRRHALRLGVEELVAPLPEGARLRGGLAPAQAAAPSAASLGYQELLRLVGQHLARREARLVRLIEHSEGLIVQSAAAEGRVTTELLRWSALEVQHRLAVRRRRAAA